MKPVTMYTKSWCLFCDRAKTLLATKGIVPTEIDIEANPGFESEMSQRTGGRRTVPQIFIGDIHVGGFDDLAALDRSGDLDALLPV
jgi:glutaredoxin 3